MKHDGNGLAKNPRFYALRDSSVGLVQKVTTLEAGESHFGCLELSFLITLAHNFDSAIKTTQGFTSIHKDPPTMTIEQHSTPLMMTLTSCSSWVPSFLYTTVTVQNDL
eukprot:CAMPEP_0176013212 /NCGR_PEP_ID=MMETSP0120_2-20121206/6191_1 /TAXON_ID=160619 /ORGANISM="Kryptoperidinium foliaceum, Strain CCMP 1326" /LENGTH=107 /DNA_ID=CAMNT_0017346115 /DNA_START=177 /DNA_END=500 /DNA_ORIENTATION=-